MITQHEKINLKDISSPHIVPCVQGDTGRSIVFDLADFTPPEGATATYYVQKPSGLAVYNTATIDGNSVLVDLTAESIAEVGDNYLQIRILDDEEVVTSFDCILAVAPFRGIDAIESGNESNIFDQAAAHALIDFEADAQEKAAETIATIPDDYTALSNSVTDLKNALNANSINDDIFGFIAWEEGKMIGWDNAISENTMIAVSDYLNIPNNSRSLTVGNRTATASNSTMYRVSPNVAFYDVNKNFIVAYNSDATNLMATYEIPTNAVYVRINQASDYAGSAKVQGVVFNKYKLGYDIFGLTGTFSGAFTTNKSQTATGIYVENGKSYKIICNTSFGTGRINIYSHDDATDYVRIEGKRSYIFNCFATGELYAYNIDYTGSFSIIVCEIGTVPYFGTQIPKVYEVGYRGWTSLTALLLALQDDDSNKIIYLHGKDYDIFQEYSDLGLFSGNPPANPTTDYRSYNVWVPSNTKIIGSGITRLLFQPTTSQISEGWSKTISVLNTLGNVTIENLEIHCKNGRYCIHDDMQQDSLFVDTQHCFKNLKLYKYTNDTGYGFNSTIGFGAGRGNTYIFDDCYLYNQSGGSGFYFHSTNEDRQGVIGQTDSPTITANNCVFDSSRGVKFGNVSGAQNQQIRVGFNSCYIGGQLRVCDENDISSGTEPNVFDITLLKCGTVNVQMISATNPYQVKEFN